MERDRERERVECLVSLRRSLIDIPQDVEAVH